MRSLLKRVVMWLYLRDRISSTTVVKMFNLFDLKHE